MAKISPTGVAIGSYNPTNSAASCPAVATGVWEAKSSPLPPVVNNQLCSCMVSSLSCVVKPSIDQKTYGQLFGQVCGYSSKPCAGIAADALTGTYGAYSMCNASEQLSFAMNQYYKSQNSVSTACDFGGNAVVKSASSASGTCQGLISQAGAAGTGTVTSAASASASKKSAAGAVSVPRVDFGMLSFGLYAVVAGLFGMGVVLL